MAQVYNSEWLELEKALGSRPLLHGTPQEIIDQFNGLTQFLATQRPPRTLSVISRDEKINDNLVVRVYTPANAKIDGSLPLCIYMHGGGYICGDLDSEDPLCSAIAEHTPCVLVSVNYRLGPQHKLPTMVEDCVEAYEWAWHAAEKLGANRSKMFTCGGSAGGGLALNVADAMITSGRATWIQGVVAIVPVTSHPDNVPPGYEDMYKAYQENASGVPIIDRAAMLSFFDAVDADPKDARVFSALSSNLKHFPPTYICTCEFDPLRDDGKIMEDALKKSGVKVWSDFYPGLPHYFWIFPSISMGKQFAVNLIKGIHTVLGM